MFNFLSQRFSTVFSRITGQDRLTEKNMDETLNQIKDALLEADVPYDLVSGFIMGVKDKALGQKIFRSLKPGEQLIKIVYDDLVVLLGGNPQNSPSIRPNLSENNFSFQIPSITMVMGLQGSGKTTTIGKLCYYIQQEAQKRGKTRSILCASVDFYRPAAIEQLELVAQKAQASFYRPKSQEPLAATAEILQEFNKGHFDLLFLDTAGRLHVDEAMMRELQHIEAKVKPKYKFLVLDSMTGQESLKVASSFNDSVGFQSAILTKMDSESRAGAAFAFYHTLKKPIIFIGTGEKVADLEFFRPERVASRILGMGDIMTLLERAEEKIKQTEQEDIYRSLQKGKLTLQDFADQLSMVGKLGSLSQVMKYFPGAGNVNPEMLEKGEQDLKKFKAIISSMNQKERLLPSILDASRKKRIAQGAGVTVADVNMLLERFEQSQQFVKLFKKFERFNKMF